MSDHIGPEVAAETARRAQRHPYAGHPAALVLADHQPKYVTAVTAPAAAVRCCCGDWDGQWCDFGAHQAEVLDQAGLLAETVCPHGTPLDAPHCQGCDDVRDGIAADVHDDELCTGDEAETGLDCICSSVVPGEIGYRHALDCPMYRSAETL